MTSMITNGQTTNPVLTVEYAQAYRLTQPLTLTLGAMLGMHMEKTYGTGFFFNRVLKRVDQRPQIAIEGSQSRTSFIRRVGAYLPPSTVMHHFCPYVVDMGQDRLVAISRDEDYSWRYNWYTLCGVFALRVNAETGLVITRGTRIEVCHHTPPWCRPCRTCARRAEKTAQRAAMQEEILR